MPQLMRNLLTRLQWFFFKLCFYRIWERCHYDSSNDAYIIHGHRICGTMVKHLAELAQREAIIEMTMKEKTITFTEIRIDGVLNEPKP